MRNSLLVASLLVAASSVAHADPSVAQAVPSASVHASAEAAPSTYLATGVTLGGVGEHTAAGVSVDFGERVWKSLWVHVGAAQADDSQLFVAAGLYQQAHAGLELSSCQVGDRVCGWVGGDVGYAYSQYTSSSFDGNGMSTDERGAIAVLRAGLDIGGKHVRWRPGVEATLAGPSAAAITQSLAFRF